NSPSTPIAAAPLSSSRRVTFMKAPPLERFGWNRGLRQRCVAKGIAASPVSVKRVANHPAAHGDQAESHRPPPGDLLPELPGPPRGPRRPLPEGTRCSPDSDVEFLSERSPKQYCGRGHRQHGEHDEIREVERHSSDPRVLQ